MQHSALVYTSLHYPKSRTVTGLNPYNIGDSRRKTMDEALPNWAMDEAIPKCYLSNDDDDEKVAVIVVIKRVVTMMTVMKR